MRAAPTEAIYHRDVNPIRSMAALLAVAVLAIAACSAGEGPREVVVPHGFRPIGDGRLIGLQADMGDGDHIDLAEVVDESATTVTVRMTVQRGRPTSSAATRREAAVALAAPVGSRIVSDAGGARLTEAAPLPPEPTPSP